MPADAENTTAERVPRGRPLSYSAPPVIWVYCVFQQRTRIAAALCSVLAACQSAPTRVPTVGAGNTGADVATDLAFAPEDAHQPADAESDSSTPVASDATPAVDSQTQDSDLYADGSDTGKAPCQTDMDCGSGGNCVAGQCFLHTPCQSDKQCQAQGQVCDTLAAQCVPCLVDADCTKPLLCKGHVCLPPAQPCASTKECPTGLVCDKTAGGCVLCATSADCPATQGCLDTVCVPKICQPGAAKCDGAGKAIVCNAQGTANAIILCGPSAMCEEGKCATLVCSPAKLECSGTKVVLCNATGTANATVKDCADQALLCNSGACEAVKVCAAGSAQCKDGALLVCQGDGTAYKTIACNAGQVCIGQACVAQVCSPQTGKCDGTLAFQCNAIGSQFEKTKDCADGGEVCKLGWCAPSCVAGAVSLNKTYGPAVANLIASAALPDGGWLLAGVQEGGKPWLLRTDNVGAKLWDKELAWNAGYIAAAVTATAAEVAVAGAFVDKTTLASCAMLALVSTDGATVSELALCAPPANPPVHLAAEAVDRRPAGGFYVAGRRGVGSQANNDDLWVARLDPAGKVVWQKNSTVVLADRAEDCLATADGGVVAVGYSSGAVAGAGEAPSAMLVRYDENGATLWTKIIGGYLASRAAAVAASPGGGFVIVGQAQVKDNSVSQSWFAEVSDNGTIKAQHLLGKVFSAQLVDIAQQSSGTWAVLQAVNSAAATVLQVSASGQVLQSVTLPTTKDMIVEHLTASGAGDLAATTSSLFSLKQSGRLVLVCGW